MYACVSVEQHGLSRRNSYLVDLAITDTGAAGEAGSKGRSEWRRSDGAPGGGGDKGGSRASEVLDAAVGKGKRLVSFRRFQSTSMGSIAPRRKAGSSGAHEHSSMGLNWPRDLPKGFKTTNCVPLEHLDRYLRTTSDGSGGGCLVGLREEIETFRENLGSTATSSSLEQSS